MERAPSIGAVLTQVRRISTGFQTEDTVRIAGPQRLVGYPLTIDELQIRDAFL